jgi:septal ring factor EnvC (AmiA/AmiB activator)
MLKVGALALLLFSATATDDDVDEATLFDRMSAREQILDAQRETTQNTTRQRALLAYRLMRRRQLGFAANPENRLDHARAFDLALLALRRSFDETMTLAHELDRVRTDRTAMETAFVARALNEASSSKELPQGQRPNWPDPNPVRLFRPIRGSPVAVPGLRRDGPTKIELRHSSVVMLARMNEPARAISSGVIKHVEALPQGGFAIVTAHADGFTSIITGLRDITVNPGDIVNAGQTIGLVGRNLDGAAVISVEIWRNRRPQDTGKLLHLRLGSAS